MYVIKSEMMAVALSSEGKSYQWGLAPLIG